MPSSSSQGASVSWGGSPIGYATSIRANPGNAVFQEATSCAAELVGSGSSARVRRQYICTAIEPGTVEVAMYGVPPYVLNDIGDMANLSVDFSGGSAGGSLSGDAFLDSFDITASVGELLSGTARFRFA